MEGFALYCAYLWCMPLPVLVGMDWCAGGAGLGSTDCCQCPLEAGECKVLQIACRWGAFSSMGLSLLSRKLWYFWKLLLVLGWMVLLCPCELSTGEKQQRCEQLGGAVPAVPLSLQLLFAMTDFAFATKTKGRRKRLFPAAPYVIASLLYSDKNSMPC